MELRSCRMEEREDAIRLSRSVFKENMAEQFQVLFAPKNIGRMLVAVDGGNVVSMVNYHFTPVQIGPATINVASVGSVCTDSAYRGRKLASRLLQLAEAKMLQENVHVVVISGEGGIYTEYGSAYAGDMREVSVDVAELATIGDVAVVPFEDSRYPAAMRLHDAEPVRFVRGKAEFRLLVAGQTYPDTFADYPFEVVLKGGEPVAYAILVIHHENDEVGVKEMAGDRNALAAAFPLLCAKYGRSKLHFACAPDDPLLGFISPENVKPIHQFASFKIIDFAAFATRLEPYFRVMLGDAATRLTFGVREGAATIALATTTLTIADSKELVKIVFGFGGVHPSGADGELALLLARIFPVPFPWTHSLNYQ